MITNEITTLFQVIFIFQSVHKFFGQTFSLGIHWVIREKNG